MVRKFVVGVGLVALFSAGLYTVSAQNPPAPASDIAFPVQSPVLPPPVAGFPVPQPTPPPPLSQPQTVEELLEHLARIKDQQKQLAQHEKQIVEALRKAMKDQKAKFKALGYDLEPQPAAAPPGLPEEERPARATPVPAK
jgi:hypothetical protein